MKTITELEALSNDELRLILAGLDGYEKHPEHKCWYIDGFYGLNAKTRQIEIIPDYPADLNACHEVEKKMSYPMHCRYAECLNYGVIHGPAANKSTFATARERTIGLIHTLQNS